MTMFEQKHAFKINFFVFGTLLHKCNNDIQSLKEFEKINLYGYPLECALKLNSQNSNWTSFLCHADIEIMLICPVQL